MCLQISFVNVEMTDTPPPTEYKIEIKAAESEGIEKWDTAMVVDDGEMECALRDLRPSSMYWIRICASNRNGWSAFSTLDSESCDHGMDSSF